MSILNDHILAEGVENLESESGRARFFDNIKAQGLQCSREFVDAALDARKEDAGGGETEADYGAAEGDGDEVTLLMRSVMVNFIVQNEGYSPNQVTDEGQPLCMRGPLETQDKDEYSEEARCEKCLSIATEITGPLEEGSQMCGMCKGTAFEVAEDEESGSDREESTRDQENLIAMNTYLNYYKCW
jgi:hypothetical protein